METNILWIHGWGMSAQIWGDVSTLLPGANHHYFSYAGCETIDSFHTAIVDQLLNAGEHAKWTLVGWSIGGMLALEHWMMQSKHPNTYSIDSIIIVSSTLQFVNPNRQLGWPMRVMERVRKQLQLNPQDTLQQFASSMFSQSDRESAGFNLMSDTISASILATDFSPEGLDAGLAYLQNTNLTAFWEEHYLNLLPILWLHGDEDSICPIGAMPPLNTLEMYVFPETGHIPFLAKPELFYEQVRSFLDAERPDDAQ